MGLVEVERRGAAVLVGLNRPEKRNALDQAMVDELDAVLAAERARPGVLILHSTTPGTFVAGADIAAQALLFESEDNGQRMDQFLQRRPER